MVNNERKVGKEIAKKSQRRENEEEKEGTGGGEICVSHGIPSAHTEEAFVEQPCWRRLETPSSSRKTPRPLPWSLSLVVAQATPQALACSPFSTWPWPPQSTWPPSRSNPLAHSVQASLQQGGRGGAGGNAAISECVLLSLVLRGFHISPLISRTQVISISIPSLFPRVQDKTR